MRLTKQDPTGTASYLADGVSPASPLLSDGTTSFTPGISEHSAALGSRFYLADAQGNSRGLLDANQNNTDGYNWDAFGNSVSRLGSNPTALAWGEESGYQTDNDSGLKLLGHRYYDSRTGRFISQDPIGDGDNWYEYADNSPVNGDDPDGLSAISMGDGGSGDFGFRYDSEGSFGSSLWNGYEITTRERTREGEDGWTNNADGSMTWGNVWGPWGDWHVVNVTEIGGMGGGGAFANYAPPQPRQSPSAWDWMKQLFMSGGQAGNHNFHEVPILGSAGPSSGGGHDPEKTVNEILKGKKGSIKNAPLEKGAPGWDKIGSKQWKDILKGAQNREPGYDTFRKLLTDKRFNK